MTMNRHLSQIAIESDRLRLKAGRRGGFSLLELIVVLAVATILTSLLLPAMSTLRENVNRVVCSSNQRQIGIALVMYVEDHKDMLPSTDRLVDRYSGRWEPQELMAVHHGQGEDAWDGLGLLYKKGYCTSPQCFYCPSHRGEHPVERYLERWSQPGGEPIYTNYHYSGHRHWDSGIHRTWRDVDRLVVASDGLRTASDFNHGNGMNVLYGDASVRWSTAATAILPLLPERPMQWEYNPSHDYNSIWQRIEQPTQAHW